MKRIGRPKIDDGPTSSASVHVRLSTKTYDAVYERAQRAGVSVPEVVRRALDQQLDDDDRKT